MSQEILEELLLFFNAFLIGVGMAFLYDGFLISRRVIPHKLFWISIEDFFFWLFAALVIFLLLVEKNDGILRWFAVCGALLGALLYKKSISRFFVNIMSTVLEKLLHILYLVVKKFSTPINAGKQRIFNKSKRFRYRSKKRLRYLKKRLTQGIKLLKITLCKRVGKS